MHPCMQNTEEINTKYAVDANLSRLGSTNPKKKSSPWFFIWAFIPGAYCWGDFDLEPLIGGGGGHPQNAKEYAKNRRARKLAV